MAGVCMHVPEVTCPQCNPPRQDWSSPVVSWMGNQPCNHCYCQPGKNVGGVKHKSCCKCYDEMAEPSWQL